MTFCGFASSELVKINNRVCVTKEEELFKAVTFHSISNIYLWGMYEYLIYICGVCMNI